MACVSGDVRGQSSPTKERISGIIDGQVVPVSDAPLLTSAAASSWPGFLLEKYSSQVVRQDVRWGWHRTHVCLVTGGSINFRVHWGRDDEDFIGKAGSVYIFPSGFDETRFSYAASDFQLTCLELDPSRLSKFLGRKNPVSLTPQICIDDVHIAALLGNMEAEIADGFPAGNLYAESLSLALAAYLAGRFSHDKAESTPFERKFRAQQARRLVEYIQANLSRDLTLGDMADLVDMSPRQFFRLFSSTFGSTPHRYVTKERISRAKELLEAGLSLLEIAQALGFASQSHFTNVFSKLTGLSPGRFRQETVSYSKRSLVLDDDAEPMAALPLPRHRRNGQESDNA